MPKKPNNVVGMRREQFLNLNPTERQAIVGHRRYVGGTNPERWYGIGKLQFHFLVNAGLRHDHKFLDVACGSLRLGQYLIPYLDKGHYFGLDGESELVTKGLAKELFFDLVAQKEPKFEFNYQFEVSFAKGLDFAMAQSLFTHLTPNDIKLCFDNLYKNANAGAKFYFTFFEGDESINPTGPSHAQRGWRYAFSTLEELGKSAGWTMEYIGDWGHPNNQKMAVAKKI